MKYTFLAIWKNVAHALQLSYVIHLFGDKVVERINYTFLVPWKNVACILQVYNFSMVYANVYGIFKLNKWNHENE